MNFKLLTCGALFASAITFNAPAVHAACKPLLPRVLFCPTPGELANAWPLALYVTDVTNQQSDDPIYALGCGFIGTATPMGQSKVIEERTWQNKGSTTQILHISFGRTMTALKDTYAPDGQYLGKKTTHFTEGWVVKREVSCDGN
jgi:hypothetical protein